MNAFKVGALARRTGLTVRTLHHYDEIGLLPPSRRTHAGHRLYGEDELRRLQQIVALKQLGLSLDEIGACLERPEYSFERVIDLQLERIDEEMVRQRRLRRLLEGLRDAMVHGAGASLEDLSRAVEATLSYERYYSAEQLEALRRRGRDLGEERIRGAQEEWSGVFGAFAREMARGVAPDAPEVAELARRSVELIEAFTGGDPDIAASLTEMYQSEGPERVMAQHDVSMPDGLWEYMEKARAALKADS